MGRKHGRAIFSVLTMFSKDLYCRHVNRMACLALAELFTMTVLWLTLCPQIHVFPST